MMAAEMRVSIVIPTLREAAALPATLDHLASLPGDLEVIVADGGSDDGTPQVAAGHPRTDAVVEVRGGGRARQLNAGAARATGDVLVFLHADSRLPAGAHAALSATRADGGNFALRFDGEDRFARALGRVYALQRRFGLYYGDSSIWVRRATFDRLGGFQELPIMDDYDFVRRLERSAPTACLPGPATTSARRWRRQGVARTVASWLVIRWLFLAGVPPDRLARLYRAVR
jgi:rSAM/selenodomain-associated transferase 2